MGREIKEKGREEGEKNVRLLAEKKSFAKNNGKKGKKKKENEGDGNFEGTDDRHESDEGKVRGRSGLDKRVAFPVR